MRTAFMMIALCFTGCQCGGRVQVNVSPTTARAEAQPLPTAPLPREKEIHCTCPYCSCMAKPFEGEDAKLWRESKCVCDEKRCKDNDCNCNKWKP